MTNPNIVTNQNATIKIVNRRGKTISTWHFPKRKAVFMWNQLTAQLKKGQSLKLDLSK